MPGVWLAHPIIHFQKRNLLKGIILLFVK
jgi:hypothetical protein